MFKKLVIGLIYFVHIAGATSIQAQSRQDLVKQVSAVTQCSLGEASLFVNQVQSSLLELRASGLSDEQIVKTFEQEMFSDASLISAGGVAKVIGGAIGILATSWLIGSFIGIGFGQMADRFEADMRQALIDAQNQR